MPLTIPDGYEVESPNLSLPNGYEVESNDNSTGDSSRNLALPYTELARGVIGAPASVVDFSDRILPWAYNTFRPSSLSPIDYPPSANTWIQNKLTKLGFPQANQNDPSRILEGAAFGPAGMATEGVGQLANAYNPQGNKNLSIGGRDIGLSPNDLLTGAVGMTGQGALSPKPMMIGEVSGRESGRVGQLATESDIPVYPTDIAPKGSLIGSTLNFLNGTPLSGKEGRGLEQLQALTKNSISSMGETADELTPPLMNRVDQRLGKTFDSFGDRYDLPVNQKMINQLQDVKNEADNTLVGDAESAFNKQYGRINGYVQNSSSGQPSTGQGIIPGTQAMGIRSDIGAMIRSEKTYSPQLAKLQGIVDSNFQAAMNPLDAKIYKQTLSQYRAMLSLEPAAKKSLANGTIDPAALIQGANKIYPNTIYDDPNDVPQLAQTAALLKNAQIASNKYQNELWKTPVEGGKIALYAATPLGAVFNRTMNTQMTPMDFSSPYGAAAYRALLGGSSSAIPFSLAPQGNQ